MSRWSERDDVKRGTDYDVRWVRMKEAGQSIHGEADLVAALLDGESKEQLRSVLDAGCGTGRVGIELARRGIRVVGVDLDTAMLDEARAKAPALEWHHADLTSLDLNQEFDVVVTAGNVMIFLASGSEPAAIEAMARHVRRRGLLIAGFQLGPERLTLEAYDAYAESAGLILDSRWATWDRASYAGGDYAVSVHRRS